MAAPFFCAPTQLRADLVALSYPEADAAAALAPAGNGRLSVLRHLAACIDPDADVSTIDELAAFWDSHGLHSAAPTSTGHRPPLTTAPTARLRDRAAATSFLRAALDLALAHVRIHASSSSNNADSVQIPSKQEEQVLPLSAKDAAVCTQLDALIAQRHILFPDTMRLLAPSSRGGAKRAPLARRAHPPNRPASVSRRERTTDKPKERVAATTATTKTSKSKMPPTREHFLALSRALRTALKGDGIENGTMENKTLAPGTSNHNDVDTDLAELDDIDVITLARSTAQLSTHLSMLCDAQDVINEGVGAPRDDAMLERVTALTPAARAAQSGVLHAIESLRRAREASVQLERARPALVALRDARAVRAVVESRMRVEGQS